MDQHMEGGDDGRVDQCREGGDVGRVDQRKVHSSNVTSRCMLNK